MARKSKKKRRGKRVNKKLRNVKVIPARKRARKKAARAAGIPTFALPITGVLMVLLLLLFVAPCQAQSQVEMYILGRIGTSHELGFRLPNTAAGVNVERTFGRATIGADTWLSPDRKISASSGHSVSASGYSTLWIGRRVGPTAGLGYSVYWSGSPTGSYRKGQFSPELGIMAQDRLGRFTALYLFPTGCVWGTSCPLQSSRLHGVSLEQDIGITSRLSLGIAGAVLRFCDQSNPLVVIQRTCQTGVTVHVVARFRIR